MLRNIYGGQETVMSLLSAANILIPIRLSESAAWFFHKQNQQMRKNV
ncbi:hypothetical protein LC593_30565 [Nostoc sp. CHAB 5844]|nr:hypothetical protein [Nostoc sp. CHAB 5844]